MKSGLMSMPLTTPYGAQLDQSITYDGYQTSQEGQRTWSYPYHACAAELAAVSVTSRAYPSNMVKAGQCSRCKYSLRFKGQSRQGTGWLELSPALRMGAGFYTSQWWRTQCPAWEPET